MNITRTGRAWHFRTTDHYGVQPPCEMGWPDIHELQRRIDALSDNQRLWALHHLAIMAYGRNVDMDSEILGRALAGAAEYHPPS